MAVNWNIYWLSRRGARLDRCDGIRARLIMPIIYVYQTKIDIALFFFSKIMSFHTITQFFTLIFQAPSLSSVRCAKSQTGTRSPWSDIMLLDTRSFMSSLKLLPRIFTMFKFTLMHLHLFKFSSGSCEDYCYLLTEGSVYFR